MKKSLFKNTIYKSMLSFVNIVVPLLIGPYIVKLLDVELYGIYNTVFAEFQVFLVFASFGLYTYGVREISKIRDDKEKVSKLFSNLFVISIISNLLVCIIYFIYAFFTSNGVTLALYYVMMTIKTVIVKILYLIAILLFIRKSDDVVVYAVIVSFVVFINNIISFIYAKKHIKFDLKKVELKRYFVPLTTILIISNIDLLYSQLDRVVLGKFAGGVAVSIYYIPYYIVSTLAAIPYSIINVSIPRLSYIAANETKEGYEISLNKIISSLMFIIIPICMGVFALANEVIFIYAGEKYMACVSVLMISCIVRILLSIESVLTNLVMYPNNQEKKLLKFSLSCGILNLILNLCLVYFKILTPFASMITTIIVELMLILLEYRYIRKILNIKPRFISKQNLLYLGLSLLFIPIAYIIKKIDFGFYFNICIIIPLCILLYVGVLYSIKDENLKLILNKALGIFRRKKNG